MTPEAQFRTGIAILSIVCVAVFLKGLRGEEAGTEGDASTLLGSMLPDVVMTDMNGAAVSLQERVAGHAAVIIVAGTADCLGCANFPLELLIVRNHLPELETLLVGSGGDEVTFVEYFRSTRIDPYALIDTEERLLSSLGVAQPPVILLVDKTGRIVLAHGQTNWKTADSQYRLSEMVLGLANTLAGRAVPTDVPPAACRSEGPFDH